MSTYLRIGAGRVGETESNSNAGSAFELQIEEDRGRVRSGRRERMLPPLVPSGQQLVGVYTGPLVGGLADCCRHVRSCFDSLHSKMGILSPLSWLRFGAAYRGGRAT